MAIKYIPYDPDPVRGQAVLDNFRRTLKYKGSDEIPGKLKRGMPYYEVERTETVGSGGSGSMLIRGECVSACAYLKDRGIEVDLVYIDPPFASGADYAKKVYIRRNPKAAAAIARAEEELDSEQLRQFEEKMYGDVWDKEKYLNWMYENLTAIKSVMSETASIYVHLDWHIGHYVKVMLDEIFGEENFRNEIVWCYKSGGAGTKEFAKKHDNIFLYNKSSDYVFNVQKEKSYMKEWSGENPAQTYYTDENGRYTLVNAKDYWTDIGMIATSSEERVQYATQKPEALLERIIKTSSDEGMIVADFFGGSGVTAAAAHKLNRRFIHVDVGINSIQTARDRLAAGQAEFEVLEVKDGVSLYRNPAQTMDKLKSLIGGLKREDSLGPFWAGAVSDSKLGLVPVYLPNLLDSGSKLLNEAWASRFLYEAIPDLAPHIKKVIVYYVDVEDLDGLRKTIAEDESTTVQIELRDLKDILDDVVAEDYAAFTVERSDDALTPEYIVTIDAFASDRVSGQIDAFNQKGIENAARSGKTFKPIAVSESGLELIEYVSLDCTRAEGEWRSDHEIKIDKNGFVAVNGGKTKQFWDGTLRCNKPPLRVKIRNICGDETIFAAAAPTPAE